MKQIIVALAGFPNCGKTTLFNSLTGSCHQVGNWSGVTVDIKKSLASIGDLSFQCVDLPGCYTLLPNHSSEAVPLDQRITHQYLESREATTILNVLNATHLEQQLAFTLALLEQKLPVIVVLNMMDEALKQGKKIDIPALSHALGCPVIPMVAIQKQGLAELRTILIQELCPATIEPEPSLNTENTEATNSDYSSLSMQQAECVATVSTSVSQDQRLQQAHLLANSICSETQVFQRDWSALIDKLVLHKVAGLPLLLGLMYLAFGFTIHIGGGTQEFVMSFLQNILIEKPTEILQALAAPAWVVSFVAQGLGQGIHTTLSFMPVIAVMFFCISFLEASGYMARAALVMDKIMRWIGLSGKSFIPMILGFGCNVPAVLATRTLECRRERILTILMSPFMSCGARLAIYALFVTSFFKEGGHNVIFALYCIGILMALLTGWVLRNTLLVGNRTPLKMELPPYRKPRLNMIIRTTWHRTWRFVTKAGVIIVPLCVLFGVLGTFKIGEETWLTFLGQYLTPLLSPMGIQPDNWPATVGLLTGVVAKEVVVGTLNALYTTGATSNLGSLVDHFVNAKAAFAYLLFVLLYFPCISVLATISRELNIAWATFTAVWTTGIAYGAAVLFYQIATFSEHPATSAMWVMTIVGVSILVWIGLRLFGRYTTLKKPQKPLPTQILILN